jgi:hypothetical protein
MSFADSNCFHPLECSAEAALDIALLLQQKYDDIKKKADSIDDAYDQLCCAYPESAFYGFNYPNLKEDPHPKYVKTFEVC